MDKVEFYRLATLKAALKLECKGMRRRGRSAYAIAKETYGLKGNRSRVLAALTDMVEKAIADGADTFTFGGVTVRRNEIVEFDAPYGSTDVHVWLTGGRSVTLTSYPGEGLVSKFRAWHHNAP